MIELGTMRILIWNCQHKYAYKNASIELCEWREGPKALLFIATLWFFPSINQQPKTLNFSLINNNNNNNNN